MTYQINADGTVTNTRTGRRWANMSLAMSLDPDPQVKQYSVLTGEENYQIGIQDWMNSNETGVMPNLTLEEKLARTGNGSAEAAYAWKVAYVDAAQKALYAGATPSVNGFLGAPQVLDTGEKQPLPQSPAAKTLMDRLTLDGLVDTGQVIQDNNTQSSPIAATGTTGSGILNSGLMVLALPLLIAALFLALVWSNLKPSKRSVSS